jgi:spore maturation protein CgeB
MSLDLTSEPQGRLKTLLFGDVTQPPFINNLLPAVRAFHRAGPVWIVEPRTLEGFVPTGAARPALIPDGAIGQALALFEPDVVVCLAGGLYLSPESRARLPKKTITAHFALSDRPGLEASYEIAPTFDLFYTQDPQTVPLYRERGLTARRCDPATDAELYRPLPIEKEDDLIFVGKWTPRRGEIIGALRQKFGVGVYTHEGDIGWEFPTRAPLNDPAALCEAVNRARLMLEFTLMDDLEGPFRGKFRMTNRPQFAASCGVPTLTDPFEHLPEFLEPGTEIEVYRSPEEALEKAGALLADEPRRREMGRRARERVLRHQTWDHRVQMFEQDVEETRKSRGGWLRRIFGR